MTRCVHKHDQDTNKPVSLYLTVVQDSSGNYRWSYLPSSLFLGEGKTKIEIKLKYTPIDDSSAKIAGYASTGFSDGVSPVSPAKEKNSAYLTILPNQIIDFGVFVEVTGGANPTTIFCDPQASNDPKV
jgi:hypothetical protein